jgi:hypothetical protein
MQRHPERDGHTEVCDGPDLSIQGSNTVCGPTTYTISTPQTGGTWSVSSNAFTIAAGSNNSTVTINRNYASPLPFAVLTYTYQVANCTEPMTESLLVFAPMNNPSVFAQRSAYGPNTQKFMLWTPALQGHTYQWQVNYSIPHSGGTFTGSFSGTGASISSPFLPTFNSPNYTLTYLLTITNNCGTKTLAGIKNNYSGLRQKPGTEQLEEHIQYTFETMFTSLDSLNYETAVRRDMEGFVFHEDVTEEELVQKEEKVRQDHLYPYLVAEDMDWAPGDPGQHGKMIRTDSGQASSPLPSLIRPSAMLPSDRQCASTPRNPSVLRFWDVFGKTVQDVEVSQTAGRYIYR